MDREAKWSAQRETVTVVHGSHIPGDVKGDGLELGAACGEYDGNADHRLSVVVNEEPVLTRCAVLKKHVHSAANTAG